MRYFAAFRCLGKQNNKWKAFVNLMANFLKVVPSLLIVILSTSVVKADTGKSKKYSFSVSNLLLPSANSNQGLANFCSQMHRLSAWPLEWTVKKSEGSNYALLARMGGVAYGVLNYYFLTPQLSLAFHEFGHAKNFLALHSDSYPHYYSGFDHKHDHVGDTFYHMLWAAYSSNTGMVLPKRVRGFLDETNKLKPSDDVATATTPVEYFRVLQQKNDDKLAYIDSTVQKAQKLVDDPDIDSVVIFAGGLNNQSIFAGKVEDEGLLSKSVYVFDFLPILLNKYAPVGYLSIDVPETLEQDNVFAPFSLDVRLLHVANDQGTVQRHYRRHGIIPNYTVDMGHRGAYYSIALSASTYQSLYGLYAFLVHGKVFTAPFSVKGVYFPNTSFFYTSKGLSLRFKMAYEWDKNLLFVGTYETVYEGQTAHEFKLTVYKNFPQLNNLKINANALISFSEGTPAFQGGVGFEYPLHELLHIEGGYNVYNANTLDGERNIPYGELDHTFNLGVKMSF